MMHRPFITMRRQRGFTMVETVICVVIVSGMLVCSLEMLGTSARLRRRQSDGSRATLLARQLMSEIMQARYEDPEAPTGSLGPEAGESRATYDDVDDYNSISAESPPQDSTGAVMAGYSGWTRQVTVEYVDSANPGAAAIGTDSALKRITVKVTNPSGASATLVGLRSRQGEYEKTYTTSATYPCWVDITLQPGADSSTTVRTSVNLVNQVP
jgi:MSHA pilin protein MshD